MGLCLPHAHVGKLEGISEVPPPPGGPSVPPLPGAVTRSLHLASSMMATEPDMFSPLSYSHLSSNTSVGVEVALTGL